MSDCGQVTETIWESIQMHGLKKKLSEAFSDAEFLKFFLTMLP